MNSFVVALSAVLPIFIYLFLGWFLRRIKLTNKSMLEGLNKLCFKVFLAVHVYYNIYKIDIKSVFDGKLLLVATISHFVVLAISVVIALLTEKDKKRIGALSHGIFHTNFVIFGTLIGTALCGEDNIGGIALLIALIVPLQNVLSVILLECFRDNQQFSLSETLISVIKNPFVISALLGFLTQILHIEYPEMIGNVIRDIGRCGTPLALIVMGGLFNFDSIKNNLKPIFVGVISRLIIVPAILIPIVIMMGFRNDALVALMCIFIAPCATSSFNLASIMDSDADLASQLVVFTSLFSLVTIFLWIFTLSSFKVI